MPSKTCADTEAVVSVVEPSSRSADEWVPQPYSRAERLLNLLMALRAATRPLDREAIRRQVRGYDPRAGEDAFTRMFERDKQDLRNMGIEVTTVRDAGGVVIGYRTSPTGGAAKHGEALWLDRDELAVVALAARLWERTNLGPAARNALAKLESRLGLVVPASGAVAGSQSIAAGGFAGAATVVAELVAAVSQGQQVRMRYRKPGSEPVWREVDPWRVLWWHGAWYLVGWDRDREATRVFRVSRIVGSVVPVGPPGAVTPPSDLDARALIGNFASDRPGTVTLALAPGRGASLRRTGVVVGESAQFVPPTPEQQGSWDVLEVSYQELPWLVAQVLALSGAARVLQPSTIRAEVLAGLSEVLSGLDSPKLRSGRMRPALDVSGTSSQAQFARMLALVPWLARNDGVTVAQAAEHFGVTSEQLLADLGSVITSGVDDWTLFDIQYWEPHGCIHMIDPLGLDQPLALAPDELLAVTVACEALSALPGPNQDPVVVQVIEKLRAAAPHLQQVVDVRPDIPESIAKVVSQARAANRTIELRYWAATRDQETERVVDPIQIMVVDGRSYLVAHCRRANALRYFRLDRILSARIGQAPAGEVVPPEPAPMAARLAAGGLSAIVDLSPVGQVLAERHPVEATWDLPAGWVRVRMPYGDPEWLVSMVLSGAGEVLVREPEQLVELVRERALAGIALHQDTALHPDTALYQDTALHQD